MNKWWKAPILQGEDNEYGEYDYLIEEIPQNTREWDKWECKCSECGKYHNFNVIYTEYFRTLDGWDSICTEVCWICEIKSIISNPFRKIKRKVKYTWKVLKETIELKCTLSSKHTWKKCYELAKKIVR